MIISEQENDKRINQQQSRLMKDLKAKMQAFRDDLQAEYKALSQKARDEKWPKLFVKLSHNKEVFDWVGKNCIGNVRVYRISNHAIGYQFQNPKEAMLCKMVFAEALFPNKRNHDPS